MFFSTSEQQQNSYRNLIRYFDSLGIKQNRNMIHLLYDMTILALPRKNIKDSSHCMCVRFLIDCEKAK